MAATDQELVRSACDGDERAFHALVDRHAPSLLRTAMSLSQNRADAEDLLQETFVGAYKGLKRFAGRSSVKTWLVGILTRQAARAWHKSRRRRRTRSIHSGTNVNIQAGALSTEGPERGVERQIDVRQVLASLGSAQREVLVLRELQGLSYEEIAQVLGIPRGTVESRLYRARAEFRERFDGRDA